jgi:probable H4MPT-linked C1 transfer pathway protein
MALGRRAPFQGAWTPLACEYFASSADLYRVLGELPEEADQLPAADGREKTPQASRARLARMVGRDAADATEAEWRALAAYFAEAQLRTIEDAARLVASRTGLPPVVIGAGVGRRIAARLAGRLGAAYRDFAELIGADPGWAANCAPAVALALLAPNNQA